MTGRTGCAPTLGWHFTHHSQTDLDGWEVGRAYGKVYVCMCVGVHMWWCVDVCYEGV